MRSHIWRSEFVARRAPLTGDVIGVAQHPDNDGKITDGLPQESRNLRRSVSIATANDGNGMVRLPEAELV